MIFNREDFRKFELPKEEWTNLGLQERIEKIIERTERMGKILGNNDSSIPRAEKIFFEIIQGKLGKISEEKELTKREMLRKIIEELSERLKKGE